MFFERNGGGRGELLLGAEETRTEERGGLWGRVQLVVDLERGFWERGHSTYCVERLLWRTSVGVGGFEILVEWQGGGLKRVAYSGVLSWCAY